MLLNGFKNNRSIYVDYHELNILLKAANQIVKDQISLQKINLN